MTKALGKKLALLGFAASFLVILADYFIATIFVSFLYPITMLIAALGFGVMWLCDREMIDLGIAGMIGLLAVMSFFNKYSIIYRGIPTLMGSPLIFSLISSLIPCLFLLAWAIKYKNKNPMVALLLVVASLGSFLGFRLIIMLNLPSFFGFVLDLAIAAIPVVAAYFEED